MAQLLENILRQYFSDPGKLEADLFEDISINREDLQESCFRQPHVFAKWAVLSSIADTMYREQKRHVNEEIWPQACQKARQELTQYGAKVTVGEVDAVAYQDEAYIRARAHQAKLGSVLDIIKKVESALWHRKSMLEVLQVRHRKEEHAAVKPKSEAEEWAERVANSTNDTDLDSLKHLAVEAIQRSKNASRPSAG